MYGFVVGRGAPKDCIARTGRLMLFEFSPTGPVCQLAAESQTLLREFARIRPMLE